MAILLVDDDQDDLEIFEELLLANGHTKLLKARSGEEALRLLKEHEIPSLILSDLNMPGVNGIDLIRALKADPQLNNIPVVIITTSSNPDLHKRCQEMGASGTFTKPVSYNDLKSMLKHIYLTYYPRHKRS